MPRPRSGSRGTPGWASPATARNRVNSALYFGGPQLLGRTVGNLVGVQPDYVFVTRFPFFEDMVKDIGGITVSNPRAFSDTYLKPKGFKQGRIHLTGYEAMAFSRIRKSLAGGDFDRSANQQRTLRGIYARIRAQADQPGFIERGIMTVMKHMHTNLPPGELFELAQIVAQVDPSKISTCVVQGSVGNVGQRQRGVPLRQPGPPLRPRRPQRRHHQGLLATARWEVARPTSNRHRWLRRSRSDRRNPGTVGRAMRRTSTPTDKAHPEGITGTIPAGPSMRMSVDSRGKPRVIWVCT